ncbi:MULTISPECIES: NfeD family protein [Pseudoalteromonas]|jgi:membrane protein implicated in regulation of membrane protease activity|uniref:NfeD family protein n=1 Tax=Pseudoalteromonas TaxID=53246 RepID=UPI0005F9F984|nr:NfeD family protein [Pseudoalteromonas piscicida]KJZ02633.1 activity regulator of membrane protease YbbK [Pseudoalteromonas piscicida]
MAFLLEHLAQTLVVLGIACLIVEVAVLGFATFVLFFLGLSLVISGGLMYAGMLDQTWLTALWFNALVTTLLAVFLWKPLRRMQDVTDNKEVTSDFAELTFTLEKDLNADSRIFHTYSGIAWQLKSKQPITAGTEVKVVKKEVGAFWVEPN